MSVKLIAGRVGADHASRRVRATAIGLVVVALLGTGWNPCHACALKLGVGLQIAWLLRAWSVLTIYDRNTLNKGGCA